MLVWLTRAGGHRFRSRPRWRTTRQSTCLTRVTLTVTVWRHGGAQGGRGDEAHAPPPGRCIRSAVHAADAADVRDRIL